VQTVRSLDEAGIRWFGAGKGVDEAGQVAVFEQEGVRIGLLGMAEHEFSIAGGDSWGANPIDLMRLVETVGRVRSSQKPLDYLIVLLHAGNEYYHYPSSWLQRLCRFLIDQGAAAVICQHSHVAGTYEEYNGGLIVYGQGNFIFGRSSGRSGPEGFLVELRLGTNPVLLRYDFIPFFQTASGLRRMTPAEDSEFRRVMAERNEALKSPQLLEERWREFVLTRKYDVLRRLKSQPRLLHGLLRRLDLTSWWYRRYNPGPPLNYVQCESHRQLSISVLESMFYQSEGASDL